MVTGIITAAVITVMGVGVEADYSYEDYLENFPETSIEEECILPVEVIPEDFAPETKLTPEAGIVMGPWCKETYYNLDMSGILQIMWDLGYNYGYWIRDDGVKMFGDYVMVAADLNLFPRGTIVETSLGPGIVCDTGEFIYENPYQFDIATTW